MLQVCGYLDFTEEALNTQNSAEVWSQYLDRNSAFVLHVASEINRRHSTRADFPLDLVPVGQCSIELRDGVQLTPTV